MSGLHKTEEQSLLLAAVAYIRRKSVYNLKLWTVGSCHCRRSLTELGKRWNGRIEGEMIPVC